MAPERLGRRYTDPSTGELRDCQKGCCSEAAPAPATRSGQSASGVPLVLSMIIYKSSYGLQITWGSEYQKNTFAYNL